MSSGTPAADVEITPSLVHRLLKEQHPDLAGERPRLVDTGWDNAIYRISDDWLARLPRRIEAVPLIENEQRWLPQLAANVLLAIPAPTRLGTPSSEYPYPWSIVPWIAGRTADQQAPLSGEAIAFAQFLTALHQVAPDDAPRNPFRGVPLGERRQHVEERIKRLREVDRLVSDTILALWERALAAPISTRRCWLHGDLHPRNILVADDRLKGIIDWGDLTAGDVATDLASIWMLFDDADARKACLTAYGCSPATIDRAMGWAVLFGTVLVETGRVDHPAHAVIGEATLRRLHVDAGG